MKMRHAEWVYDFCFKLWNKVDNVFGNGKAGRKRHRMENKWSKVHFVLSGGLRLPLGRGDEMLSAMFEVSTGIALFAALELCVPE